MQITVFSVEVHEKQPAGKIQVATILIKIRKYIFFSQTGMITLCQYMNKFFVVFWYLLVDTNF